MDLQIISEEIYLVVSLLNERWKRHINTEIIIKIERHCTENLNCTVFKLYRIIYSELKAWTAYKNIGLFKCHICIFLDLKEFCVIHA